MVEYQSRNINIVQPKDGPKLKILVMGEPGVGKSALVRKFCGVDPRAEAAATIGVDSYRKSMANATVTFWDLSGHPDYFEVRNEFYKECQGIVLVYDITSRKSFDTLDMWLREANRYGASNVPLCVCGNKSDLANRRAVQRSDAEGWAQSRRFDFAEVSATSGQNVTDAFERFIHKARR